MLKVTMIRDHFALLRPPVSSGFTLIELVVVMVVVGIVAAIAIPRFSLLGGFSDVAYRDQIKSTLAYARKAAVARRRHTCLVFAADSSATLSAEPATPDTHVGNCPYDALMMPSGASSIVPPSNVSITSPTLPLTIQFNAEGRPIVGGGTIIVVTSAGSGSTSSVTIEADSGYVH